MNDMTPTREQREAKLEGMGCKRKRVEDARFTQGKGNYVDDLKLPGMLHGDFVRSPHAHERVKSINSEEALKVPGVLAVITASSLLIDLTRACACGDLTKSPCSIPGNFTSST